MEKEKSAIFYFVKKCLVNCFLNLIKKFITIFFFIKNQLFTLSATKVFLQNVYKDTLYLDCL